MEAYCSLPVAGRLHNFEHKQFRKIGNKLQAGYFSFVLKLFVPCPHPFAVALYEPLGEVKGIPELSFRNHFVHASQCINFKFSCNIIDLEDFVLLFVSFVDVGWSDRNAFLHFVVTKLWWHNNDFSCFLCYSICSWFIHEITQLTKGNYTVLEYFSFCPIIYLSSLAFTSIFKQEKGRPLPKFGEWDVNDPASAEGFTVIFNKARDEKKTGGKPESPTKVDGNRKEGEEPLKPQPKKWFCCMQSPHAESWQCSL